MSYPRHLASFSWISITFTEEPYIMPFEWAEFLQVARFLATEDHGLDHEAAMRCAVSRAYYSAYGYALKYAMAQYGFRPSNGGDDHGKVRELLRNGRRANTASKLQAFRRKRNDCDYGDALITHLDEMVNDALADAEFVVDDLKLRRS